MDFAKLFKSVEDAVYEVMVWLLLLPKSFLRLVFRPGQAIESINEEFEKKDEDDRFDDYLSPVMVWLLSAVIPLTLYFILTSPDIETVDDFLKALSGRLYQVTFYMMVIPFVYIAWMEWLNKEPVKRSTLKKSFYKHCSALAPAQILTILSIPLAGIFPLLAILSLLIIPAYEALVFKAGLGYSYGKAFLLACVPQVAVTIVFFFALGSINF